MATAPHKYTNRLAECKSPYLLQHAHNPVDWYPWGPEALEKARKENKPIFLSIGYSTCHWCHVMEHESFEDEGLAAILNRDFVSIKVDREERPDLDHIYMNACQLLTQRGGWPMSLFLTAEGKPFYAGTYFPKEDRFGQAGFVTLLSRIAAMWKGRRNELASSAEAITDAIQSQVNPPAGMELSQEILKRAYDDLAGSFDEIYGGFGSSPKFPSPHNLSFLLRWWDRSGDDRPLYMARRTLTQIRQGGICDHIGFGFHRYSTDREFLLPHFEKMLYDQALLAIAAIETFQATGEPLFARMAQEIFTYLLRDMTSPEGAFYSAEDADSEGVEGKFYVWTKQEILDVLGNELGELFCRIYDIRPHGNFLDEATREETGVNIVHLNRPIHEHSVDLRLTPDELRERLEEARQKLFEVRGKRIHPHKDDKILTSWNGLAIVAFARGFCALGETHYAAAAMRAADFILSSLINRDGRLLARYRDGEAVFPAYMDDYAYLVWGLIELYQATFDVRYLEKALTLNRQMRELFRDDRNGGFFFTGSDAEELVIRTKEVYDGALPSGNSVAALNLLRLGRLTGDQDLEKEGNAVFRAFSTHTAQSPSSFCQLLMALDFALGPTREIILAGDLEGGPGAEMLASARRCFLPRAIFLHHPEGEEARNIEKLSPLTVEKKSLAGNPTAYVCTDFTCKAPVTDVSQFLTLVGK